MKCAFMVMLTVILLTGCGNINIEIAEETPEATAARSTPPILSTPKQTPTLAPPIESTPAIQISNNERICYTFLKDKMILEHGGVRTNYLDEPHAEGYATGDDVLSESQGLLMRYAVYRGDEDLFLSSYGYVTAYLDLEKTLSYRNDPDGVVYPMNAVIDDLRIVRALIEGANTFENEAYRDIAKAYSARLYETNVIDGYLYDMYDQAYDCHSEHITLCYIDLYTLRLMQAIDSRWEVVYDNMLSILEGGYLGDRFPFYMSSYYYGDDYDQERISMIEAIISALNLAEVDRCPQATIDYLKEQISSDKIYNVYSVNGKPRSKDECTAIYALCAQLGATVGDEELTNLSIAMMERLQIKDENHEAYGGFVDANSLEGYSFDNLMALLAYCAKAGYP